MKRRTQLVTQYLENVSRKALEKYQGIVRQHVQGRHGIYALFKKDRLYYVGLATDLRNRLKSHLRDKHAGSWDKFSVYLTIGDSHMRELETLFLRMFLPKGNNQKGNFKKAENLKPKFKREVMEHQKQELDILLNQGKKPLPKPILKEKPAGKEIIVGSVLVFQHLLMATRTGGRFFCKGGSRGGNPAIVRIVVILTLVARISTLVTLTACVV